METTQRIQGGLICLGAAVAALVFLGGLWSESYWALAVPVAALVLFVLGLVFWVGWTILTVQVEPEADPPAVDPRPEPRDR